MGVKVWTGFNLHRKGPVACSCEQRNETLVSVKKQGTFNKLSDY